MKMSINKTGIEWCTHTWNPFIGCLNGCPYCYAKKTAENKRGTKAFPNGFDLAFHPERLLDPGKFKRPAIIFADSMSDMFGDWWAEKAILQVLHVMDKFRGAHWHKFVVLTKKPGRMAHILSEYAFGPNYLSNVYFGTSVTGAESGFLFGREAGRLGVLKSVHDLGFKTVISFEPLLSDPKRLLEFGHGISWADWIIIGGQTGPSVIPEHHWVMNVLWKTTPVQPVFIKKNAGPEWVDREFPADLAPIAERWGKQMTHRKIPEKASV